MHFTLPRGLLFVIPILFMSIQTGAATRSQPTVARRTLHTVVEEHKAGVARRDQGLQPRAWMYWRGFYDSLHHYEQTVGPERTARAIERSAGVRKEAIGQLSQLGTAFVEALTAIDVSARATLLERHGTGQPVGANGERFVLVQKGLSPFDLAQRDGLVASVEAQYTALLAKHIAAVKSRLAPEEFSALSRFVDSHLASRTTTFLTTNPGGPRPISLPTPAGLSGRSPRK